MTLLFNVENTCRKADVIKNATHIKMASLSRESYEKYTLEGIKLYRANKICSNICELYVCYIKYFLTLNKTIMTK